MKAAKATNFELNREIPESSEVANIEAQQTTSKYELDSYNWALVQSELLRTRSTENIDWENLAEEIAAVARSEKTRYSVSCSIHSLIYCTSI